MTEPHELSPAFSVLLLESQRIFAEVLAERLRAEPDIARVLIAATPDEAATLLDREAPGLVLVDSTTSAELGPALIGGLQRLDPTPRVMVLAATSSAAEVVDALTAGADGWVSKELDYDSLLLAVNQVLEGRLYLSPDDIRPVVELLVHRVNAAREHDALLESLTSRQLEVLRCLVAGMSRAECAERLHLSVNTVRTHVQLLLRRADVHSALALTALARDAGVRGIDDPTEAGDTDLRRTTTDDDPPEMA